MNSFARISDLELMLRLDLERSLKGKEIFLSPEKRKHPSIDGCSFYYPSCVTLPELYYVPGNIHWQTSQQLIIQLVGHFTKGGNTYFMFSLPAYHSYRII